MYQSLYRTWRPRTFSEMAGQEHVVRTLKNQADTGHIAHAYLFSGSRGTGKTSAARILSMAINCQDKQQGDPCLKCQACIDLQSEATLDVFEMDAASNSRVEEIREMLEKVNYPPQSVRYKVYIIDEVHMLSNAAFNALLKTLEEPPEYMVFILATTEPQKIPATILSRCQRFDFGRIREEDIIARMKVALGGDRQVEEDALRLIAFTAEGSMRDAWSLLDMCLGEQGTLTEQQVRQAIGAVDRGFLYDFADALAQRDAAQAMEMIDQLMRSGKDVQVFLKDFSQHLRQLISAGLGVRAAAGEEAEKRLREQAQRIPLSTLTWLLERAVRAEGDLRWAAQARTVLTVYALTCCQLTDERDATALLARVEELERALAGGQPARKPTPAPKPAPKPAAAAPAEAPPAKAEEPPQEEPEGPQQPPEVAVQAMQDILADESEPAPMAPEAEAPPAPMPDQQPMPAAAATPKDTWNGMLQQVKRALPSVYSMLYTGKYAGFEDGLYRLRFEAADKSLASFLMDEDRRQSIEKILTDLGGQPARFEAFSEASAQQKQNAQEKAQQDIQALSDLFGRKHITVEGEPRQ